MMPVCLTRRRAVAFAPREELSGSYIDVATREGFRVAHEVSSYSLTALAKAGRAIGRGRPVAAAWADEQVGHPAES